MTAPPLAVHLRLQELRYLGGGEESAETRLWVVFLKIDGDGVVVDQTQNLRGNAVTAVAPRTPRLTEGIRPGDRVAIPESVGSFRTILRPIPLTIPIDPVDATAGVIGFVSVLWEEDNTPEDARVHGPALLKSALQRELDTLIPTLRLGKEEPNQEEIDALKGRVADAVKTAIKDRISIVDVVGTGFDFDDECGTYFETFDSDRLLRDGPVVQLRSGRTNHPRQYAVR